MKINLSDDVLRIVVIPALVGLAGGMFVMLAVWPIIALMSWPFLFALAAGGACSLAFWMTSYLRFMRTTERLLLPPGQPDPQWIEAEVQPDPQPEPEPIRIELISDGGSRGQYLDLPCSSSQLEALADGLASGRGLALAEWQPTFSRREFETIRSTLVQRGLARANNEHSPNQGYSLSPAGRAMFRKMSTMVDKKDGTK